MEKDGEEPNNGDGEWGWSESLESDDHQQHISVGDIAGTENDAQPSSKISNIKMIDTKHAAVAIGHVSLANGIKSSPSFQELENAIGATLAMSMTDMDQNQAYMMDYQRQQQNYKYGYTSPRTFQPRQYRHQQMQQTRFTKTSKPKSQSECASTLAITRGELEMFINEAESRAIIVFHSPNINPSVIRNACQLFGVLYYLRPEFHSKGVTLLGYFDLRSAISAHANLANEISGQEVAASVHFSVMLHSSNNCDESRLVIRNLPVGRTEADVQNACSRYGQLRSIQRTFDDTEDESLGQGDAPPPNPHTEFTLEYFNIQDARLAASELSVNVAHVWGGETTVNFSPLDNRKQQLSRQLLILLSRWRSDLSLSASSSFGDLVQQHSLAIQQQQQYHLSAYGAMEVPMGMGVGMGVMLPGYGQVQYAPSPGTFGQMQYGGMVMGRGVPVAMSASHPYGMNTTTMLYPSQLQSAYAQAPSHTHGHGHSHEDEPTSPVSNSGSVGWEGMQGMGMMNMQQQQQGYGGGDKNPYYPSPSQLPPSLPMSMPSISPSRQQHGSSAQMGGSAARHEAYPERPPHHNGGHVTGQARRTRGGGSGGGGMGNQNGISSGDGGDFVLDLEKVAAGADNRTTLMIRNIPNKYTQTMLLNEINVRHEGTYDFYYLPIDFKNKCNVGYAFINFMEPRHIIPFFKDFNAQRWSNFNSEKVCSLSYARIQGKAAMVARFQNSSLLEKDNEYRPLLFYSTGADKGKPEPFSSGQRLPQVPANATVVPSSQGPSDASAGSSVVVGGGGGGSVSGDRDRDRDWDRDAGVPSQGQVPPVSGPVSVSAPVSVPGLVAVVADQR